MVAVRPGDAETALSRRDPGKSVILLFGPDTGLVRERADAVVKAAVPDASDPFALVRLEGDELSADPQRLIDETSTIGLFGGERVIRVRAGSRNIVPALKPVLEGPAGALVVVEAGDLKRGAALRSLCEGSPNALAIACYADTQRDLARLVDTMMAEAGLSIDRDAKELLVSLIGGDRMASRGEIAKLTLYAAGTGRVSVEDVRTIVGDASALALDDVVDCALSGNAAGAVKALAKAFGAATRPDAVLGALLRGLSSLHQMALQVEAGLPPERAVEKARPMVHFSRKPKLEKALRVLSADRCAKLMLAVDEAILSGRRNAPLAPSICERVVLQVAQQAARRRR
ncbi:DNA polymerase III subunit delta [Xanthobacter sp. TB0139]|uniref:DNA polymerase III subunit delta n=1 Tax=Xanthobacter sp. TB0139 TaxID=3459178 RepID=UPI00403A6295